ncbi:MAG TPA: cytochrome c family protein [Caulobacteraceae bacterium]|jgi:cytochrome c|nr:cytochrome c family protein [Caulobacteraceae bacterium]
MSDELSTNKVLGAILGAALLTVGLGVIVPEFFPLEPPKKDGFKVDVPADLLGGTAAPAPADIPPDWGTVLPKADVAAGQAATAICQACHNFSAAGTNMIGPGLYGVVGRKPGSHPGFAYSQGMTEFSQKQPVWDYEHIYEFIKNPGQYIPGTKMTFAGLKDPQARINVIAYLHTLGSNLPVPKPNPAAAATAAKGAPAAPAAGAAPAGAPPATASAPAAKPAS